MKKFFILFILVITSAILCKCDYSYTITKWEEGIIPYYYEGDFTKTEKKLLRESMNDWEKTCNIKFKEVDPQYNAFKIKKGKEWYSTIGESMDKKYLVFGSPLEKRHILHELGHCLGFLHEHQRPDRNKHVKIIWSSIIPEYKSDFKIIKNPLYDETMFKYDFDSIMHYHGTAFSNDGSNTITALDGREIKINTSITDIDAVKAAEIYGPPLKNKGGSE